jgi:hypothetical protein
VSGHQIVQRRQAAAIRHGRCLHAGHGFENLHEQMMWHAGTGGREGHLVLIGLGVGEQFGNGFHRQVDVDHQHERRA